MIRGDGRMNQFKFFRRAYDEGRRPHEPVQFLFGVPMMWGDGRINQFKFFWDAHEEGRRPQESVQALTVCP
jgi:hypothetical protein